MLDEDRSLLLLRHCLLHCNIISDHSTGPSRSASHVEKEERVNERMEMRGFDVSKHLRILRVSVRLWASEWKCDLRLIKDLSLFRVMRYNFMCLPERLICGHRRLAGPSSVDRVMECMRLANRTLLTLVTECQGRSSEAGRPKDMLEKILSPADAWG